MARRTTRRRGLPRPSAPRRSVSPRRKAAPGFVGRDPSPVRDSYPEKAAKAPPPLPPLTPPTATRAGGRDPSASAPLPSAGPAPLPGGAPEGLIRLERPFDPDEVSRLLGETSIRLTVPRDALAEVLRRVTEFMGFGIYVYAISIRPAPSEMLRGFVVELQRVDYDAGAGEWRPFVERGAVGAGPQEPT